METGEILAPDLLPVKQVNRTRVYRHIYSNPAVSSNDIAKALDLSRPTVTQNLRYLEEAGLIESCGNLHSTGGRKAVAYQARRDAFFAVGVSFSRRNIRLSLVDSAGRSLFYAKLRRNFETGSAYAEILAKDIESFVTNSGVKRDRIVGVGLAFPGIISESGRILRFAPSLSVSNLDLSYLNTYIPFPLLFENDADMGAYAEFSTIGENQAFCLFVANGVGGAFVHQGLSYKGLHNKSGEIGHLIVRASGRICSCGKAGCLEAYISTARLSDDDGISLEAFFSAVDKGHQAYRQRLDEYLDYLCIGISNINAMLDCPVILSSEINLYLNQYMDIIREKLRTYDSIDGDDRYFRLGMASKSRASCIGVGLKLIHARIGQI